jgi:ActR/RegA family two-component response regulator
MEKRKLLLVDDEASIRMTLGAILEMRGFEVTTAATVAEALSAIQRQRYDVLLSDLNIGQPYDGFTVASATRRLHPDVATVMITGYPAFDAALDSIRQQVDDYMVKPTDVEDLVRRIEDKLTSPKRVLIEQRKRPVEVIGENHDAIITKWLEMVGQDSELGSLPISAGVRTGHLPTFLKALTIQVSERNEKVDSVAMLAAAEHGRQRREQGYTIPQVIRETRILKNVLYGTLQEHLLEIKISQLIAEIIALSMSLTEQLENSIRAFMGEPLAIAS